MEENVVKEMFVNVYGYDTVKKELSRIKAWFMDEEIINKPFKFITRYFSKMSISPIFMFRA